MLMAHAHPNLWCCRCTTCWACTSTASIWQARRAPGPVAQVRSGWGGRREGMEGGEARAGGGAGPYEKGSYVQGLLLPMQSPKVLWLGVGRCLNDSPHSLRRMRPQPPRPPRPRRTTWTTATFSGRLAARMRSPRWRRRWRRSCRCGRVQGWAGVVHCLGYVEGQAVLAGEGQGLLRWTGVGWRRQLRGERRMELTRCLPCSLVITTCSATRRLWRRSTSAPQRARRWAGDREGGGAGTAGGCAGHTGLTLGGEPWPQEVARARLTETRQRMLH